MKVHKVGLVVGLFVALIHALWSAFVAVGYAQGFLDFIYGMHFLQNPFIVQPFNLTIAVGLVIVTLIIGYVSGAIFAWLWNKFHKA